MTLESIVRSVRTSLATAFLLAASAVAASAQAPAEEVECAYTKRTVCTTAGCQPSEIGSSHLRVQPLPALRTAVETVSPIEVRRCDASGCSGVEITDAAGGGFLTLSSEHGAYLLKIYTGPAIEDVELYTGDFIEVVTSMLMTWVGYGRCGEA